MHRGFAFELPGMATLDLRTLPKDQAEALLLSICPRIGAAATALAKLCGGQPLALRVSASLLASRRSRRVEDYLQQLGDERTRLEHLRDPRDPELDVAASLRLSYDALEEMARPALCQLSVFLASFGLAAAQSVVALPPDDEPAAVLEDLCHLSLLEWDEQLQRYSLHDLVRMFAAARLDDVEAVRLRYAGFYARLARGLAEQYRQGGKSSVAALAAFDGERIHLDAGWSG